MAQEATYLPRGYRKPDQGTGRTVRLEGTLLPFVLGDRGRLSSRHLRLQSVRRAATPARPTPTGRADDLALAALFLCRSLQSRRGQTDAQTRGHHRKTPRLVARAPAPNGRRGRLRCSCRSLGQSWSPTHPAFNSMSPLRMPREPTLNRVHLHLLSRTEKLMNASSSRLKRKPGRLRRDRRQRRRVFPVAVLVMLVVALAASIVQNCPALLPCVGRLFWETKSEAMELLLVVVAVVFRRKA